MYVCYYNNVTINFCLCVSLCMILLQMVRTLLEDLPGMFSGTSVTHSALGAALQVAEKLLVSSQDNHPLFQNFIFYLHTSCLKAF